jgi:hypothetical protein
MRITILVFSILSFFKISASEAQISEGDSTFDKQILILIQTGAYAAKLIDSDQYTFNSNLYDSVAIVQIGDSILTEMMYIPESKIPISVGQIIYSKTSKRIRYTSENRSLRGMKTIIEYDKLGNEVRKKTNDDMYFVTHLTDKDFNDSLFLKFEYTYDQNGNMLTYAMYSSGGLVEIKGAYDFYPVGENILRESYRYETFKFLDRDTSMAEKIYEWDKTTCSLDTLKRLKNCSNFKFRHTGTDTVLVSKDNYVYDANWSIITQDHYGINNILKYHKVHFPDASGNDTLIKTITYDSKEYTLFLTRIQYDSNRHQILHEHYTDGNLDRVSVSRYDQNGHLIFDSTNSDDHLSSLLGNKSTYAYDSKGNLTEEKRYKDADVINSKRYIYYYKK